MADIVRTLLAALAAITFLAVGSVSSALAAPDQPVTVYKTATCGCCTAWIDHLEGQGFETIPRDMSLGALTQKKIESGVPQEMASCHTGIVDGYVIEGHVPAQDIARLLDERPDAIGLAVPGMPIGSPGMEIGDVAEQYTVYLMRRDGTTEAFASYPAR